MLRTRLVLRFAALLLVLAFAGQNLHAQVLYGSLTGNIVDPSNSVIPGAKVEAVNTGTGVARQTNTDERGAYAFTNVQPGTYKITVAATSFKTTVRDNVGVSANGVRRADFQLQIAQAAETVEVTGEAAVLQTDKADVHAEISSQEVEEIPYNGGQGRNFQSLLYLIPGAGIPATVEANSDAGNPQRAQSLYMNGVSATGNSTKLDGTTISYPWLPINVAYIPPSDAIETVNVVTNAFDAEQGAAGGVAVNVAIKSGTNHVHGSLYEYNQNNDMTAVNYFAHSSPLNKNVFNQFGFTFGGPVWIPKIYNGKNKLFFFTDWQGTRRSQYAASALRTIATPAMRQGNFAGGPTIYDPYTGDATGHNRTPFEGNVIPSNRIDPASAKMASLLPALTRNTGFQNYDAYGSYKFNRDNIDSKISYNPNDHSLIWGRYSVSPMDIIAPQILGAAGGDAFNGGQPGHAGGRVQSTGLGVTYTFSPTVLVDGNFGYTRQHIGADGDAFNGAFGTDVLKIPGTNGSGSNYAGIPSFQISNHANMGNASTGSPFEFRDNQYTSAINLSKIRGSHQLRFGFGYDHYALNHFQPQGGSFATARGTFGFNGTMTALNGGPVPNNPTNSFADFLLGVPFHAGKVTQFTNPNALRFSDWAVYVRDQWQVTRNLTLNYGMRWEYYPIFAHDFYGATRFDPATGNILIGGYGGVPWDTGASANKKNFAPRIGLAYRLGPKTVIRTGYGITVDPDNMRNQRNAFPSSIVQDYNPANTYAFVSYPGVPQVTLRNGVPSVALPDISAGIIKPSTVSSPTTYSPFTSTSTFPRYMNRGYIQSWNFFIQREVSPSLTVEAGYAGTHAVHTIAAVNINGSAPGTGTAGRQLYPFMQSDLNSYMPYGSQKYSGLQTRLRKRIGWSTIGVSYTFSKALNSNDNGDSALFRAYPSAFALNKGLAGFDRTHNLQIFHYYQLPVGKGHRWLSRGLTAKLAGNWTLGGTLSRYSGLPFTVNAPNASLNAAGQTQTADQLKPDVAIFGGHDPQTPYFDGSAFGPITTARLGSSGRNILRGPGVFKMDQSVSRIFNIGEKVKLQLTGQAFNLMNHPSFGNPGASYNAPTLNADGSVRSYNGYTTIGSTVSQARQLQIAGRITF